MCDKSTILGCRENIDTIVNICFFKYMVWDPYNFDTDLDQRIPFSVLTNPDSVQGHTFRSGVYRFYLNMVKLKLSVNIRKTTNHR